MAVRKNQPAQWLIMAFHAANFSRGDGRSIVVFVGGPDDDGEYAAIVLEGATKDFGTSAVLHDHGHRVIGTFANDAAARRAAEGFARRWIKSGKSVEECACLKRRRAAA